MPDQSTLPVRPSTPAIDTYWTNREGSQNARYVESANGVEDKGLEFLTTDRATGANGSADVPQAEIDAATQYLADVQAYCDLHGGFWPANGQPAAGDHTDVSSLEQGAPA